MWPALMGPGLLWQPAVMVFIALLLILYFFDKIKLVLLSLLLSVGLVKLTERMMAQLTSFVRWQMSRLVSDYVPARLHHWSSAALDCLPSATELFQSLLLVSGTVCLNTSPPHLPWLSSGPVWIPVCFASRISPFCGCTVPAQWR